MSAHFDSDSDLELITRRANNTVVPPLWGDPMPLPQQTLHRWTHARNVHDVAQTTVTNLSTDDDAPVVPRPSRHRRTVACDVHEVHEAQTTVNNHSADDDAPVVPRPSRHRRTVARDEHGFYHPVGANRAAAGVPFDELFLDRILIARDRAEETPVVEETPLIEEPSALDCSVCFADVGALQCSGDESHSFCTDCFNHYALAAFQAGGMFCVRISSNGVESPRGALPCPFFQAHGCSCHAMPEAAQEHLSPQAVAQKNRALRRLEQDREEEAWREEKDFEPSSGGPIDLLRCAVEEVLFIGASVACPRCGHRGEKDHGCMHITCSNFECRHPWCYCCGRSRDPDERRRNRCKGCDSRGCFMEYHPRWGHLQREPGESAGYGALREFHRRRIAYFLRRFREAVPEAPWDAFWRQHSDLLLQVPTPNRRITQRDISTAKPPVFSSTQVSDLRWLTDADAVIHRVRVGIDQEGLHWTGPARRWHSQFWRRRRRNHPGRLERGVGRLWRRVRNQPNHRRRQREGIGGDDEVQRLVEDILGDGALDEEMRVALLASLLDASAQGPQDADQLY